MSIFGSISANGNSQFAGTTLASSAFNTAVGDLIVVGVGNSFASMGTATVADTAGNVWNSLTLTGVVATDCGFQWWYTIATHSNAANVVTITTLTNAGIVYGYFWNVTMSGTPSLDQNTVIKTPGSGANTTVTSNALANTGTDEAIFGVVIDTTRSITVTSVGAGFTQDPASGGSQANGVWGEHGVFVSPGSKSTSFTYTGGANAYAFGISFNGGGGGATPKPVIIIIQ